MGEKMRILSIHPCGISRWDLPSLLPIQRKVFCGFLSSLKIHRLGRFEPANFGSSGKHTNHYTTTRLTLQDVYYLQRGKMEVVCTSETSVYSKKTTQRCIPEGSHLLLICCYSVLIGNNESNLVG
jgi:hypothetical protein